jgi:hypothetical protein
MAFPLFFCAEIPSNFASFRLSKPSNPAKTILFSMPTSVFLSVFQRNGPVGRWKLVKSDPIQSVFPHETASDPRWGFAHTTDYRLQCNVSDVLPFMLKIERELNGGLTANEAEMAFPRLGQHNRTVYSARLYNNKRQLY